MILKPKIVVGGMEDVLYSVLGERKQWRAVKKGITNALARALNVSKVFISSMRSRKDPQDIAVVLQQALRRAAVYPFKRLISSKCR
jgi:hypothetical protein